MIPLWLLGLASAATVYINGVRADALPATTMEDVNVRFDTDGNVWIDAPQYHIEVVQRGPTTAPATATAPLPKGLWWLVVEDVGSSTQQVDVAVNGTFVVRVKSGDPQHVVDLAPFLRKGKNTIVFQAAAAPSAVGTLKMYVGRGTESGGSITLGTPAVRYNRRAGEGVDGGSEAYSFDVE